MTLEVSFRGDFGEFPSLDRLTVGMSNRLRVTPRYWGADPLDSGDRYMGTGFAMLTFTRYCDGHGIYLERGTRSTGVASSSVWWW